MSMIFNRKEFKSGRISLPYKVKEKDKEGKIIEIEKKLNLTVSDKGKKIELPKEAEDYFLKKFPHMFKRV